MTEAEWLATDDPARMLVSLREAAGDCKKARRRIRLVMAAGCRQVWGRFGDLSQRLIEASENYADGSLGYKEFRKDWDAVFAAIPSVRGAHQACMATHYQIWDAALDHWMTRLSDGDAEKLRAQANLLRDVFGPAPFQRAAFEPRVRARDVLALAEAAYLERELPSGHLESPRLAILADALEDAGYSDAAILSHLRSHGPHVRACFALDLCLGKK